MSLQRQSAAESRSMGWAILCLCVSLCTHRPHRRVYAGRTGVGRGREAQCPPSASHCFNGSRGENKDFMAVTNISSHTFYSPQLLRMLGSCRSWKIHKTHVNFYVQLFQVSHSGRKSCPVCVPVPSLCLFRPPLCSVEKPPTHPSDRPSTPSGFLPPS